MRNGGAHAVGIRVGSNDQVGLDLLGKVERQLQRLAELGVGVLARGEVAVGVGLLGHDGDVVHANLLEDARDALHARTVERRVDNLVALGRLEAGDGDLLDGLDEGVENLLRRPLDEALLDALVEVHHLDAAKDGRLGNGGADLIGCLVGNLAAVVVVDLVAVVLRRVVRRRKHNARGGVQVAHRKGERGDGLDARVDVYVHPIGGKDAGGHALEVLALEARVARDGDGGVVIVGVQVVGHALGCLGNHVDVHAVGAHAQRSAQACGAKLEVAIEGVVERVLVASADKGVELGL